MSENLTHSSIFTLEKQKPVNPLVIKNNELHSVLGFSFVERPGMISTFRTSFFTNVVKAISNNSSNWHKMPITTITDSMANSSLPIPDVRVAEKEGKTYFDFALNSQLRMIAHSELVEIMIGTGARVYGYIAEHIFLTGNNQRSLDLLSLRRGVPVRNFFMFSDISPGFEPMREYRGSSSGIMLPFLPDTPIASENFERRLEKAQVLLSPPRIETDEGTLAYYYDIFPFQVLHENAHAALADRDVRKSKLHKERRANAVALETVRTVNRLYPSDRFFDPKDIRYDIYFQMVEGHGTLRTHEPLENKDHEFIEYLRNQVYNDLLIKQQERAK